MNSPDTRLGGVAEALGPEDLKIVTLARSARARVGSVEGAAVRDETGRTYAAAAVALPSLRLSALTLAVAMAVSSGATALEAAALVSDGHGPAPEDVAAVKDIGSGALIIHAGSDGIVREMLRLLPVAWASPAARARSPNACQPASRGAIADADGRQPAADHALR
jgi:hypothetical protein